jgi:peptidyl-dipeptidase Dcp
MYRAFAGHDPEIQPYLDYYGLTGGGAAPAAPPATPATSTAAPQPERGR